MKQCILFSALALAGAAGTVNAQTCASPIEHIESNAVVSGDTCSGTEIGLNLGGVILPHKSVVYSFVAGGPPGGVTTMPVGTDLGIVIAPDCVSGPIAIGSPDVPMDIGAVTAQLTAGQTYLFIVTGDPGVPVPAPPAEVCGPFTINTSQLPVELQSFSVD